MSQLNLEANRMYTKACCCCSERRIALKVEQLQHLQFEINWQANILYLLRLVQLGFKKITVIPVYMSMFSHEPHAR